MLRHPRVLAVLAILALASACGPEAPGEAGSPAALAGGRWGEASPDHSYAGGSEFVTVMTRNLYLGADIARIGAAKEPEEVPFIVGQLWAIVQQTDFPARAKLIAKEIAMSQPEIVGLQEAYAYYTGPGNSCVSADPPLATTVAYDFLDELQGELRKLGLHYDVASSVENFKGQFCAFVGGTAGPIIPGFIDVRAVDRDAILVRDDVRFANEHHGNYKARAAIPVAGGSIEIPRGWTSIDAEFHGEWFRFFETHLEEEIFPAVQEAQAAEIVHLLGGKKHGKLPRILVGDFNAGPQLANVTTTYADLTEAGYRDPWPRLRPRSPGLTCCFDEALMTGKLETRIDLTFFAGSLRPLATWRVGLDDRTPSGLHASDHAGVVSVFRLQEPKSFEVASH